MPSSDRRTSRRRANPQARRRKTPGARSKHLVLRKAADETTLLARILNTPHLARVVPHLQPDVLHRVIQACGLEDSAELVALATPVQLERVFDLDLWRAARPGSNDELDADRFGKWLEVLLELGEAAAAEKLAGIDAEVVTAALAQHVRVFDLATRGESDGDDEVESSGSRSSFLSSEIGGYLIEARRSDAWHAIVSLLPTLDADHPNYFHHVMRGCIRLSNSGWELDGLDDLLSDSEQDMYDLAVDREERREKQGYVAADAARAFLHSARQLRLTDATPPSSSHLARAYFRDIDRTPPEIPAEGAKSSTPATPTTAPADADVADVLAAIAELIGVSGESSPQPRALLTGETTGQAPSAHFHAQMQCVCDIDTVAYTARTEEFAYLANTMLAGGSIQGRALTPREASDAAAAICNLGIQHWPAHWSGEANHRSEDFLLGHDLITVFQVGYSLLYAQVTMRAAERLIEVLSDFRHGDPETQTGLDELRVAITREWRAGTPWRARDALDVLLVLDQPAWATMAGLVSECPVMRASLSAARLRAHTVDAAAFEFISDSTQIAVVHEFLELLPQLLFA